MIINKKIFSIILLLTIFLENSVFASPIGNLEKSSSFLKGDLGINFYKKIDESIGDIEEGYFRREFSGKKKGGEITKILNKVAVSDGLIPCFTKETSFEDIELFIGGNISIFKKILDEKCTNNISARNYEKYSNVIIETHRIMRDKAKEKMNQTIRVMKSGIYSDGNLSNSTFDLISDINDINKILFTQKIDYYGDYNENIGDGTILIKELLKGNNPSDALDLATSGKNQIGENIKIYNPLDNSRESPVLDGNNILCPPVSEKNEAGLDTEIYNNLIKSLKDNSNKKNNSSGDELNKNINENNEIGKKTPRVYNKKNDDGVWVWCGGTDKDNENFSFESAFCIDVSFETYRHNLLGGGKVKTIQGLLERSNGHLKPFANSSLAANKMGVNNFEIGFLDLNLPDLFHVNIILRKEPVPILNLKRANNNEKDGDTALENMLKKYFINAGLDYKRENDLKIYRGNDFNVKNTNKSKGQNSHKFAELARELSQVKNEERKVTINSFDELMKNQIFAQEGTEIYSMFTEITAFTLRMKDYSQDLNAIIKKMKDIPSL